MNNLLAFVTVLPLFRALPRTPPGGRARPFLLGLLPSLFLVFLLAHPAWAQGPVVEMFSLSYRPAQEIIPLVQPFVSPPGVVSGVNYQLIVRATPAEIETVRAILQRFDTMPHNLLVTVVQNDSGQWQEQGGRIAGQVPLGEHGRVIIGGRGVEVGRGQDSGNGWGALGMGARQGTLQDNSQQQVRVMDGGSAFIRLAEARPVQESVRYGQGRNRYERHTTSYVEAGLGFYVTPRLNGDQVMLDLFTEKGRFSGPAGNLRSQETRTTVSGRLGEWMEIGGLLDQQSNSGGSLTSLGQAQGQGQGSVRVKVEVVP